ncbi:hypothetical protein [Vulgatibacter sp.]|uniref:hypothetical protein n=1 Tax=Vulgatibacter sp. TaxID=1971226 RepID=UPI003566D7FC
MERPVEMRIGNRKNRRLGLLFAAAMVLVLGFLLALPALGLHRVGPEEVELRELYVREIVAADELGSELVVLQAVDQTVLVPIFVPPEEGKAIRAVQAGEARSVGLVEQTVIGFGAEIRAVLLEPSGGSLGGVLIVEQQGAQRPIELSPGAAIATALSTGQPILTTPQALEATGLDDDDLRRLVEAEGSAPDDTRPTFEL